jgi:hypothetical protein
LRAIECALEILTDANERLPFNPSIPDARLKACVGAGELASAHVGGGGDGATASRATLFLLICRSLPTTRNATSPNLITR